MFEFVRVNMAWRAIPVAWLAAGTVFLLVLLLLSPIMLDASGVMLLRYAASLILGVDALVDPGAGVIALGVVVHYALALVYTVVIAVVVHRWDLFVGIVGGAILGLAFYAINWYALTGVFPWFFAINSPVLIIGHVLFGAVAGGVYELLDNYDLPLGRTRPHADV